jgi:hypothetical protein
VEFQPDLQKPKKPVPLGIVLFSDEASGEKSALILGRKPRPAHRPPEFSDVSDTYFQIAASWIESMTKDILESGQDIDRLCQRWRWNLYVAQPKNIRTTNEQDLFALAKSLYEKFVGEQFRVRHRKAAAARIHETGPAVALPPAWQVESILRNQLEPSPLAAIA